MAGGKKNKNVINEADFKNNPALDFALANYDMEMIWSWKLMIWIINNATQIWALAKFLSLAFCEYFAFISIRKEAINKIQIDSRSRKDSL